MNQKRDWRALGYTYDILLRGHSDTEDSDDDEAYINRLNVAIDKAYQTRAISPLRTQMTSVWRSILLGG